VSVNVVNRARMIAVASGKGGVGKTNVSVNLAVALAEEGERVMLVDCDMGLANAALLLGMDPPWTIGDLLAGRCNIGDLIQQGPGGLQFVPGHHGTGSGSTLSPAERQKLLATIEPRSRRLDQIIIDTAAGIDTSNLALIAEADEQMIVVAPEPTSFMDAYALVKALVVCHGTDRFRIVCNMVRSESAGRELFDQFRSVATRFLDVRLDYAGSIPHDPFVREAVVRKRCLMQAFPGSPAAKAFSRIARGIAQPRLTPAIAAAPRLCLVEEIHGTC